MLILYTKDNCEYCKKVKQVFADRRVTYQERNIANLDFLKEAQAHNARTMPFAVDTTANQTINDSDEIIAYGMEYAF